MTTTTKTQQAKIDRAEARLRRAHELLGERPHAEGCPGEHFDASRLEAYDAERPAQPTRGLEEGTSLVIRCLHCGGSCVRHDLTTKDLEQ